MLGTRLLQNNNTHSPDLASYCTSMILCSDLDPPTSAVLKLSAFEIGGSGNETNIKNASPDHPLLLYNNYIITIIIIYLFSIKINSKTSES